MLWRVHKLNDNRWTYDVQIKWFETVVFHSKFKSFYNMFNVVFGHGWYYFVVITNAFTVKNWKSRNNHLSANSLVTHSYNAVLYNYYKTIIVIDTKLYRTASVKIQNKIMISLDTYNSPRCSDEIKVHLVCRQLH